MAAQDKNSTIIASKPSLLGGREPVLSAGEVKQFASLIPKLRFKEFEGEWDKCLLGKISLKIGSGSTPSGGNQVYQNFGIPFIRSQNVTDNRLVLDETHISEDINLKMQGSIVKSNDILLNITGGSIGRTCVVPKNFIIGNVNQHVCIIRLKEKYSPRFIQPFLTSHKGQKLIYQGQTGSGREGINFQSIRLFKLNIPSLPEQQKIASFLSAVDEKIQLLTKKKEALEQYKKGVMQQLFSQKIRFTPSLEDFKDELAQGKVIDLATNYPDWEEKRLAEIAVRNSNKNKDSKVNFVLTNSATQGIVSQGEYFDRDIANQNNLAGYYIVEVNDFVYNPRISVHAPVGPIKRNKLQLGIMSPLYSVFRFKKDNLEYFEYYFETKFWHRYLDNVSNMGARHDRMNITNEDFYKMPIPLPCNEEREKITDFLSSLTFKIESVNQQIEKTQTFKKGLLQQMFI